MLASRNEFHGRTRHLMMCRIAFERRWKAQGGSRVLVLGKHYYSVDVMPAIANCGPIPTFKETGTPNQWGRSFVSAVPAWKGRRGSLWLWRSRHGNGMMSSVSPRSNSKGDDAPPSETLKQEIPPSTYDLSSQKSWTAVTCNQQPTRIPNQSEL